MATGEKSIKDLVFLSYSRKDVELMHRVRASLFDAGLKVIWTDESIEPGTPLWDQAIEEALQRAGCMVVILTPNSSTAKGVRDEIHYANIHEVHIFPILAGGDEKSAVPLMLVGRQWIDARKDYPEAIKNLAISISSYLNLPPPEATGTDNTETSGSQNTAIVPPADGPRWRYRLLITALVVLVFTVVVISLLSGNIFSPPVPPTDVATLTSLSTQTPVFSATPDRDATRTALAVELPTIQAQARATQNAQLTLTFAQDSANATRTALAVELPTIQAQARATQNAQLTQTAFATHYFYALETQSTQRKQTAEAGN